MLIANYRSIIYFMSETKKYARSQGLHILEAAFQEFGPIFTINQAGSAAGKKVSRPQLRWYLSALVMSGRLETLKRGTYALKNLAPGTEIHPFAIAMALVQPAAISHWSALARYDFTTQMPKMVQISAPGKVVTPEMRLGEAYQPRGRAVWKAMGVEVEIIHIRPYHFFGHQKIWVDSWHQVTITDTRADRAGPDRPAGCFWRPAGPRWISWKRSCRRLPRRDWSNTVWNTGSVRSSSDWAGVWSSLGLKEN